MDNLYKSILFQSSIGYALHEVIFDENNNPCNYIILEANKAFETLTGLKSKAIVGKKITEAIPQLKEDDFDWIGFYGDVTRNNSQKSFTQYSDFLKRNYWVDVFSPKKNHFVTLFSSPNASESNFKNLFNTMPSGGIIYKVINDGLTGDDYIALDFNKRSCELYGKPKLDLIGKTSYQLSPNLNKYGFLDIFRRVWKSGIPEKFSGKKYENSEYSHYYDMDIFKLSKDTIVVIYDDATKFVLAQNEIKKQKDRFQAYIENAPYGVFISDENDFFIEVNKEACKVTGYSQSELIGKNLMMLIEENRKDAAHENIKILKTDGLLDIETKFLTKSKEVRWWSVRASKLSDQRYLSFVVDITDKKNSESMIKRFEKVINLEFIGYIFVDMDKRIIHINDYFANVHGFTAKELIGETLDIFYNESQLSAANEYFEKLKKSGTIKSYELMHCDKSGREFPMVMSATVMKDESGNPEHIAALALEITGYKELVEENTQMQMMLQNQQKLESIGTLASGVAHEINNPINGIMNYSQLIADNEDKNSENYIFASEIINETKRVAEIVNSLLQFSRQGKTSFSFADISDIISSSMMLIKTLIKHESIDFIVKIQDNLPQIECRSQQIQQVILNLITNSADSLTEKYGKVSNKKELYLTAKLIEKNSKEYVQISVKDNGIGISRDIKGQVFDPFFTTKPRDRGTGLGLAISYGIINEHGGDIYFESDEENTTIFYVDLPACK